MMDEAADRCRSEGFIANRYFLAHPDPNVSRLAANLISEKYQLSKYHTKYRELEQEEDKLDQLVIREFVCFQGCLCTLSNQRDTGTDQEYAKQRRHGSGFRADEKAHAPERNKEYIK